MNGANMQVAGIHRSIDMYGSRALSVIMEAGRKRGVRPLVPYYVTKLVSHYIAELDRAVPKDLPLIELR